MRYVVMYSIVWRTCSYCFSVFYHLLPHVSAYSWHYLRITYLANFPSLPRRRRRRAIRMFVHLETDQLFGRGFLAVEVVDERRTDVQRQYAEEGHGGRADGGVCSRESFLCVRDYAVNLHSVNNIQWYILWHTRNSLYSLRGQAERMKHYSFTFGGHF